MPSKNPATKRHAGIVDQEAMDEVKNAVPKKGRTISQKFFLKPRTATSKKPPATTIASPKNGGIGRSPVTLSILQNKAKKSL